VFYKTHRTNKTDTTIINVDVILLALNSNA
jgi:hypothetical protein